MAQWADVIAAIHTGPGSYGIASELSCGLGVPQADLAPCLHAEQVQGFTRHVFHTYCLEVRLPTQLEEANQVVGVSLTPPGGEKMVWRINFKEECDKAGISCSGAAAAKKARTRLIRALLVCQASSQSARDAEPQTCRGDVRALILDVAQTPWFKPQSMHAGGDGTCSGL